MTRTVLTGEYSGEELSKMLPSIEDTLRMYSSAETYRVTIVRLERPCCEKWRGQLLVPVRDMRDPLPMAKFCPNCGGEL